MRFTLTNTFSTPIEIGMPMVFDNVITDRTLDQAHAQASFVDPYIGRDAGYLQVTRLNGKGSALLVLPAGASPLEAYVPLKHPREPNTPVAFSDRSPRGQASEGFYDWTVHSAGFVDREWKRAGEQSTAPTSGTLAPGQTMRYGMFVWDGMRDGMETNLNSRQTDNWFSGAPGVRPTFSSYMYGDARAIAATARLAGDATTATDFDARAAHLKKGVQDRLWDPKRDFFFQMFANDEKLPKKLPAGARPVPVEAGTLIYQSGPFAGDRHGRTDRAQVQVRERALRLTGFARSATGAWVRPDNLAGAPDALATGLRGLGLDPGAVVLVGCAALPEDARAFAGLWPRGPIEDGYRYWLGELAASAGRLPTLDAAEAARESFLLGQSVIRAINSDPLLPPDLIDTAPRTQLTAATIRSRATCGRGSMRRRRDPPNAAMARSAGKG